MILNNSYNIITSTAGAADCTVSGHLLNIIGAPTLNYLKIESIGAGYLAPVAEVSQVTTVTFVAANNTTYSLFISQYVPSLGRIVGQNITHVTDASGQTATDICNAFRAQISKYLDLKITATGAATLILTAQAGAPIFTVTNIGPSTTTQVTGTAGVKSRGTYADLVAAGVTGASAGNTYSQISFTYNSLNGTLLGNTESSLNKHTVYVQVGIANKAAFDTQLGIVLDGTLAGVANPDSYSLQ